MNQNNRPTALVAIGGNSLIADQHHPDIPHQWDAVRETCSHLADMVDLGWRLVITHGNGPQVGFILRRNELAEHEVHPDPAGPDRRRHPGLHRLYAAAGAEQ